MINPTATHSVTFELVDNVENSCINCAFAVGDNCHCPESLNMIMCGLKIWKLAMIDEVTP